MASGRDGAGSVHGADKRKRSSTGTTSSRSRRTQSSSASAPRPCGKSDTDSFPWNRHQRHRPAGRQEQDLRRQLRGQFHHEELNLTRTRPSKEGSEGNHVRRAGSSARQRCGRADRRRCVDAGQPICGTAGPRSASPAVCQGATWHREDKTRQHPDPPRHLRPAAQAARPATRNEHGGRPIQTRRAVIERLGKHLRCASFPVSRCP